MPCYLRGTLRITDFEKLQQQAIKLGLRIFREGEKVIISKSGARVSETTDEELIRGGNPYLTEVVKQYAISQVKMAVQKKGWKVSSIKEEGDKIIMRLRE